MQNSDNPADSAMNCFNEKYYRESNHFIKGYIKKSESNDPNEPADFWTQAEMIEMVEDAYLRSRNPLYFNMIDQLYEGFLMKHGSNWLNNSYNDDIMWMILACTRAHMIKRDEYGYSIFKGPAIAYFDALYKMAYDDELGGGLYWTRDKKVKEYMRTKNACINCPAIITAIQLYKITGCMKYLEKAQNLYSWVKYHLFDNNSGQVYDHKWVDEEVIKWTFTYNQGTFIGAAHALYRAQKTPDYDYIKDAKLALDFTINNFCDSNGILDKENHEPKKPEDQFKDSAGFEGIFARWAAKFIWDPHIGIGKEELEKYKSWMQNNAKTAWANRNSDKIMFCDFTKPCPDKVSSWAASSGVVFQQVVPL